MTASCHLRTSVDVAACRRLPYRNPVASTAGFLLLPAFDANIHLQPASMMIGRMTGAFGADDVVSLGAQFRKLRFQMIADTNCPAWAVRLRADAWIETFLPAPFRSRLCCVCQLDLAPFDTLIWPHLAFVPPALAGASS